MPIAGVSVRRVDLETQCDEGSRPWRTFVQFCVVTHVCGVPALITVLLLKFRKYLVSRTVRRELGLFYYGYEPRWTYWEGAVFARKAMLLYAVISDLPFRERQILVLLVVVLALLGQALADPFDNRANKQLDTLEQVGLAGNIVTLLVALLLDSRAPNSWMMNLYFEYIMCGFALLPHAYFNLLVILAFLRVAPDPMARGASVVSVDVLDEQHLALLNVSQLRKRDRAFLTVVLTDSITLHCAHLDQFTFTYLEAALFAAMIKLRGTNRVNWRAGVQELHDQILKQNSFPAKPYLFDSLFLGPGGKVVEFAVRPTPVKVWDAWLPKENKKEGGEETAKVEEDVYEAHELWRPPTWLDEPKGAEHAGVMSGATWTASAAFMDHAPSGFQLSQRFPPEKPAERPAPVEPPETPRSGRGVLFI